MEIICKICNNKSNSLQSFSKHILNHGYSGILKYYIDFENFEIPKCKCGKDRKLLKGIKFRKTCGNKECLDENFHNRKIDEKTRKKISKSMISVHKKGIHPGWSFINKDDNRRSYPEKWFIKNVLEKHNLDDKYTIKEKFPFHKYFLDFAIIDLKIDVEIDGQQHFRSIKAIEYDKDRDNFLINNGWRVCRISWLELKNNPNDTINNFLKWINENHIFRKYDVNEVISLIKAKKTIYGNRENYFENIRNNSIKKNKPLIDKVKNSGIDFSKYGWVKKVSELIGIKEQKVNEWMKKFMNDFYNEKCFKRKKRPCSSTD